MNSLRASPWLPAVPSHRVVPARLVACVVSGTEAVLLRTADGTVRAWEDRCPHRGVRLSLGHVDGAIVRCAYHGWEYEAGSGACARIPAHPAMPPPAKVKVTTLHAAEAGGMVWIALQPTDEPPRAPAPGSFARTLTVRRTADEVVAALLQRGFAWNTTGLQGRLDHGPVTLFVQSPGKAYVHLHCWAHEQGAVPALLDDLRMLRAGLERGEGAP